MKLPILTTAAWLTYAADHVSLHCKTAPLPPVFLIALVILGRNSARPPLTSGDYLHLVILGVIGFHLAAYLFLNEQLGYLQFIGTLLVIAGVFVISTRNKQ